MERTTSFNNSRAAAPAVLTLRPAAERGRSRMSWLDSWHTFSFDHYLDRQHMSFGPLRVINEDTIAAGGGFGKHPHRDMEIITFVTQGQVRHEDSLGNGSVISPGEIQKMSAGTGIVHSEFNASDREPVHLLQIWIVPSSTGLKPAYEQRRIGSASDRWVLLGGPDGDALVSIEQKVKLYLYSASSPGEIVFSPERNAKIWVQMVSGGGSISGINMNAGDGLSVTPSSQAVLQLYGVLRADSQLLLFEIAENS